MIGFAEVAALITVVGAAIYVLGLVGLAWPIYSRWNNDASTTWYAMSLIPRAVVAGQGMRIFMGFPTVMATYLFISWLTIFPTLQVIAALTASRLVYWAALIFAILLVMAGGRWLLRHRHIQWILGPTPENPSYGWLAITVVGLSLPIFLVAGALAGAAIEVQAEFPFITVSLRFLLVALILAFLANFLLQLIDATAIDPPLPMIEINLSDGPQTVVEGKLLTHFEGVVYFFDEQHNLTSMPDSKVTSVRVRKAA